MLFPSSIKNPHNDILEHLVNLNALNSLPHALLFTGPEGIGKQSAACLLAESILGINSTGADLYKLKPETAVGTYSIDQIRFIQKTASCTPYEGHNRVFIIDKADKLSVQATNALLKLIEEPPEGNYFILVSAYSYKLLPTLSSRLQKIKFQALEHADFIKALDEMKLNLGAFTFMAEGSIGKASVVAKYKNYLDEFCSLIPCHFLKEFADFHAVFEKLDEDKEFEFSEFFPLFEDLMRDYLHFNLGLKQAQVTWSSCPKKLSFGLFKLNENLKALQKAVEASMKLSSAFELFFIKLNHS